MSIRSETRLRPTPYVTIALIGITAFAFLVQASLSASLRAQWISTLGFVPGRLAQAGTSPGSAPAAFLSLLTAPLLCAGWLQFLLDIVVLLGVGHTVERSFGHALAAFMYMASGLAGLILEAILSGPLQVPFLGAAGATAGLLGAYAASRWSNRIALADPFGGPSRSVPIWILILFWLGLAWIAGAFSGVPSVQGGAGTGWTLVGGVAFGLGLAHPLERARTWRSDRRASTATVFNPYDNPDEEYRPFAGPRTHSPYDNEDEDA